LTSRYVVAPLLFVRMIGRDYVFNPGLVCSPVIILDCSGSQLLSSCFFELFQRGVAAVSLIVSELILVIRVSALYGHNKIVLGFLAFFFTCQVAALISEIVIETKMMTPVLNYNYLPGCWMQLEGGENHFRWYNSWCFPFLCFDGILLILTLVKALSYRDNFNPTIRLLARDSILYFVIICAIQVANIAVAFKAIVNFNIPVGCVACIAVSRMMMNIQSLAVFNNPLASQGLPLSTIVFHHQSRTEGEDGLQDAN